MPKKVNGKKLTPIWNFDEINSTFQFVKNGNLDNGTVKSFNDFVNIILSKNSYYIKKSKKFTELYDDIDKKIYFDKYFGIYMPVSILDLLLSNTSIEDKVEYIKKIYKSLTSSYIMSNGINLNNTNSNNEIIKSILEFFLSDNVDIIINSNSDKLEVFANFKIPEHSNQRIMFYSAIIEGVMSGFQYILSNTKAKDETCIDLEFRQS
ncbi:hypothetical protein [Acidianus brierleyi]|uniref:Uncharacterized protein n=1 Tax=Acidianus brierleyi TaxID=41673 RepID=A0A2U9IFV9_9CREN|nr:hypothetical protein [Acidianus brierleyi]AWR94876.1 hypothetical protein DFR85_09970 [Acidianus brierleyi]